MDEQPNRHSASPTIPVMAIESKRNKRKIKVRLELAYRHHSSLSDISLWKCIKRKKICGFDNRIYEIQLIKCTFLNLHIQKIALPMEHYLPCGMLKTVQ